MSGAIGVVIGVSVVMIWNERSRVKPAREVSVEIASEVSVELASSCDEIERRNQVRAMKSSDEIESCDEIEHRNRIVR